MSADLNDFTPIRSDSIRNLQNESFTTHAIDNTKERIFINESEIQVLEPFGKQASLGALYKVRWNNEYMISRMIKFTRVKNYVIEEIILKDIQALR